MLYNEKHAELYDAFKPKTTCKEDVQTLLPVFQDHDVSTVIDVGCGTGGHAATLTNEGHDVIGVDIDAAMLSVAKSKHPSITFSQQSAEKPLPDADAITLFDSVFTYLSPEQRDEAIASYSDAINEGGVLYLDIAFTTKTTPQTGWEEAETATWQDTRYEKETSTERVDDELHTNITVQNVEDDTVVDDTTHVHHIVNPDQLRTTLRANDFSINKERGHQSEPWKNWEVICARV